VRALVERIEDTAGRLVLSVETAREPTVLIELTTYATTLTMNYLTHGSFVPKARGTTRASGARHSRPEDRDGHPEDRDRPRP
jgi:hypothetical protein